MDANKIIKCTSKSDAIKFFSKNYDSIVAVSPNTCGGCSFIMKRNKPIMMEKFPEVISVTSNTWYGPQIVAINAYAKNPKAHGFGYGQSRMQFSTVSKGGKYCKWVLALKEISDTPKTMNEILEAINKNTSYVDSSRTGAKTRVNVNLYSNKDVVNALKEAGFVTWISGQRHSLVEITPTGKKVLDIIEGNS